jgi:acetyl-CoA carboxylase biotin carboxyl carrier protein
MTKTDDALDAIARAAHDLVPKLTERLVQYGLGEIEASEGDLRLRVVAPAGNSAPRSASAAAEPTAPLAESSDAQPAFLGVGSPAVGFFVYADGLGPGLSVTKGDALGHVEMLGVRHDVRAPRGGTVRNLVAESGEAVEYGQVVVELEPAEATR